MNRHTVSATISLLFMALCLVYSANAIAREQLYFDQTIRPRAAHLVQQHVRLAMEEEPSAYDIAQADLNKDGINEYILRSKSCEGAPPFCRYIILAELDNTLVELGQIQSRNMMLSDHYTNGIRDILVFVDRNNDFTSKLYIWEPAHSQYILKE